jgi:tetratricopeptide (TPR) repeat protein
MEIGQISGIRFAMKCLLFIALIMVVSEPLSAQNRVVHDSIHQMQQRMAIDAQKLIGRNKFLEASMLLETEIMKHGIQDSVRDLLEILYIQSLGAAGKTDSAIMAGKDWSKRDVYNVKPHQELYKIYFGLGDYNNAAHQLELCLMRKPGDVMMIAQASMLYMQSENLVKGEHLGKLALEKAVKPTERAAALTAKAMLLLKKREYELALNTAKEAIAEDSNYPESFYVLGVTYARLGREDLICQPLVNAIERKGGPWCKDFYETRCLGR